MGIKVYLCSGFSKFYQRKETRIMEARRFKTRGEQSDYYANLRGWEPLTDEDKAALDDAVRSITHLD